MSVLRRTWCRPSIAASGNLGDFDGLYQQQTAEYGFDLAKEFYQEQQKRVLERQQAKTALSPQEDDMVNTGYFSNTRSQVTSLYHERTMNMLRMSRNKPDAARKKLSLAPATTFSELPAAGNGDNLFLVMSATMVATVAGTLATPHILFLIWMVLLSFGYCFIVMLGDGILASTSFQIFAEGLPAYTCNTGSAIAAVSRGPPILP